MKAKTIKSVLRKKHDDWLSSIDDDHVRTLARRNSIITGGCIASMLLKEKVNDYDIYFTDKDTVIAVAGYYVEQFNAANDMDAEVSVEEDRVKVLIRSDGVAGEEIDDQEMGEEIEIDLPEDDEKPKYRPVYMSSNAITLSNKIQLIIRFYGDPDQIHENYDFVHCTNYWVSKTGELTLRPAALESLLTRELRYTGSLYPLCSIIRTRKFIKRNWTINAGQYLKMAIQLQSFDLTDPNVLEDQLIGVDVAYFYQVITAVKDKSPEKIESAYLIEIIDRMF